MNDIAESPFAAGSKALAESAGGRHEFSRELIKREAAHRYPRDRVTVSTLDGEAATLAVIDKRDHVLDAGPSVAAELFELAVLAYRDYLTGKGMMRIYSSPEGLLQDTE